MALWRSFVLWFSGVDYACGKCSSIKCFLSPKSSSVARICQGGGDCNMQVAILVIEAASENSLSWISEQRRDQNVIYQSGIKKCKTKFGNVFDWRGTKEPSARWLWMVKAWQWVRETGKSVSFSVELEWIKTALTVIVLLLYLIWIGCIRHTTQISAAMKLAYPDYKAADGQC